MNFNRNDANLAISSVSKWDIVIIGGGATGLGIAVDSASRGYKTLLVEQYDFAKGTSSKSTKLVHGGVRYLGKGNIKLVYTALKERGLIFQNAPHVSFVQSFVIPTYSILSKYKYLFGLKLYDWMAGSLRIGRSVALNKAEVIERLPWIKTRGLKGGVQYFDGQFDDSRLALNLAQTAVAHGATILNYAQAMDIEKTQDGQVCGVTFVDKENNAWHKVQCRVVINATGVFVDDILKLDQPTHENLVRPSQGIHLVVDRRFLGNHHALMIPKTSDGRVLFGIPWHGKTLLGTTDTPLDIHQIEPKPLENEIEFILNTAKDYLNPAPTKADICSIFAGLRPLAVPKRGTNNTKEISRDHKLIHSASGLITITGGKWTTYRKMAEDTVDLAIKIGKLEAKRCRTAHLPLHGYSTEKQPGHWQIYGTDAIAIQKFMESQALLSERIHPQYDFRIAEIVWACQQEMSVKVEDFLARRIRLLLLDAQASLEAAPIVAKIMAQQLGKDDKWIAKELLAYEKLVKNYRV